MKVKKSKTLSTIVPPLLRPSVEASKVSQVPAAVVMSTPSKVPSTVSKAKVKEAEPQKEDKEVTKEKVKEAKEVKDVKKVVVAKEKVKEQPQSVVVKVRGALKKVTVTKAMKSMKTTPMKSTPSVVKKVK